MKTFRCNNCGHQIQRPTQPYSCPQCGRQAVGLFKAVPGMPAAPGAGRPNPSVTPPAQPAMPAQPGGWMPPMTPPAQPTSGWPAPPATPPAQPGIPGVQPGPRPFQPGIPAARGGAFPQAPSPRMPAPPPPPGIPVPPQPPASPTVQPWGSYPPAPAAPASPAPPVTPPVMPAAPTPPIPPAQPPTLARSASEGLAEPPSIATGSAREGLSAPPANIPPAPSPLPPLEAAPPRAPFPPVAEPPAPPPAPRKPSPPLAPVEAASPAAAPPEPQLAVPPTLEKPKPQPRPAPPAAEKPTPRSQPAPPPAEKPKAKPQPAPPLAEKPRPRPQSQPAAVERKKPAPAAPLEPVTRPKPVRPERFLWAFPEVLPPDAENKAVPLRNAPAVDSAGRCFVHVCQRLYGLVEEDGKAKVLWEYVTGSHAPGPVVLGPEDTVRLHCGDGYLHCVAAATGRQAWPPAYVGEPLGYAAPIVDPQGNTFISAHRGGLLKVDTEGKVRKSPYFRSRQKLDSAGIISRGVLYVGSEDGYLFALELGDERAANLWNQAAEQGCTGWYIHSAPAVTEEGIVVVAGQDGHLYGFAPGGSQVWKTSMPGQMLGSPVLDRFGHIYVGISQLPRGCQPRGMLVCLDGNSHKIRWEYRAAGPVESTPVIGDDEVLYFGDNAGLVHAVDLRGKALWTAKLHAPVRSAGTILAPKRLAFGLDDETLAVLECSSAGLAPAGWPKIARTLGQGGTV